MKATRVALILNVILLALSIAILTVGRTTYEANVVTRPSPKTDEEFVKKFHELFYHSTRTWDANTWCGIRSQQNPLDLWITQEIIWETRPDVIVECGAFEGGGAAAWATLLHAVNPAGRVVSIDIVDNMGKARLLPIVQEKVTFLVGSSTSPQILAEVKKRVEGKRKLVILDSDHRKEHVLNELKLYSPLLGVGEYLIVQDSNLNGHPILPKWGPGPHEAVEEFLKSNDRFAVDSSRERLMLTFCPGGFLKRVK